MFRSGKSHRHVITVRDETRAERCPIFLGITTRLHWSFPDPSGFLGTREEKLDKTREVHESFKNKYLFFSDAVEYPPMRFPSCSSRPTRASGCSAATSCWQPVRLVILVLIPQGQLEKHLPTMVEFAKLLQKPDSCRPLIQAPDAGAMVQIIRGLTSS